MVGLGGWGSFYLAALSIWCQSYCQTTRFLAAPQERAAGDRGEESKAVSLEILLLCVCSGLVPQGQCRKLVSPLQLPNLVISPEGWYFIQSAEQKASMENLTPIHAFRWAADSQRFL